MTAWTQVPKHCWPRSAEDVGTVGERLGGRTVYVFGPKVEREIRDLDGKVRRRPAPAFVEYWLEFIAEAPVPARKRAVEPQDPKVRDFIRAIARRSARAWAEAALRSSATGGHP